MTMLSDSPCDETFDAARVPRIYKIPSFIPLRSVVSLLEFIRETRQSIEITINICKGKKAVVFRDEDWELLSETIAVDAHSANFARGLRKDIENALGRAVVLDVDPLTILHKKLRQIERRIKTAIRKACVEPGRNTEA